MPKRKVGKQGTAKRKRLPKPLIPANMPMQAVLAALDDWARRADIVQVRNMWRVLTALRGPDEYDPEDVKHGTTSVIRGKSLPTMTKHSAG